MPEQQDVQLSHPARAPKLDPPLKLPSVERWNQPEKDTPHPKTKEKPQQDGRRGAVMIK